LLHQTGVACVPGEAFFHDERGEFGALWLCQGRLYFG